MEIEDAQNSKSSDLQGQKVFSAHSQSQKIQSEQEFQHQINSDQSLLQRKKQKRFRQKDLLEDHQNDDVGRETQIIKKPRRLIKLKNQENQYGLRKQNNRDKLKPSQEKQEKQQKFAIHKKQDDRNLESYVKIIEYLKKIQWDQQNSQNKMNPFHFMTANCFWFWVCAQFYSCNFFVKNKPQETAREILSKVFRVTPPMAQRLSKSILQEIPAPLLPFETKSLRDDSLKITEYLKQIIENTNQQDYYEPIQKCLSISECVDDDLFRSTTRALLYKIIKQSYMDKIQHLLDSEQSIIGLKNQNQAELIAQSKSTRCKTSQQQEIIDQQQKHELQCNEKLPKLSLQPDLEVDIKKVQDKGYTNQELILSGVLNLSIDKIIELLESSIPELKLPHIQTPMIPMPSDPFQLINEIHPEQYTFLQYLKNKRLQSAAIQEPKSQKRKIQQNHEDARCQICTDGDYTQDNLIVFCSTCNISLHQRCVGLCKVPTQNWICQVCLAFGPKGRWLRCALCPVKGGALKRTNVTSESTMFRQINPTFHQYLKKCTHTKVRQEYPALKQQTNHNLYYDYYDPVPQDQQSPDCHFVWVHFTCAIWISECFFQEKNGNITIKGLDGIDKKKFKISCEICQNSRNGAVVKCAEANCDRSYHPECARISGIYMQQRHIQKLNYFIYCNFHKPLRITRIIQSKAKKAKQQITKFCRAIEKYVETYKIANVPFRLLKSSVNNSNSKKIQRIRKQTRMRESKQDREQQNQDFMIRLKDYLLSNRKLVIQLKKMNKGNYKVIDIQQPVKRSLRSNISKNDEIWQFFTYRNMSPAQLFKKYKKIMKDNVVLRQNFIKEIRKQSKKQRKNDKRNRKMVDYQNVSPQQDPDRLYCVCKQKYIVGQLMIQCQICSDWFHFKCIGFTGEQNDAENVEFNCYKCEKYQSQEQKTQRRNKYKQYYDPNFIVTYPPESESQEVQQSQNVKQNSESIGNEQSNNQMQQEQPNSLTEEKKQEERNDEI